MNKIVGRITGAFVSILASVALPAVTAQAHHSFAMCDTGAVRVFTGVVTRVDPAPNHLQIFFAPMNAERANVERAAFDPLDTPAMQCVPPNLPSILHVPYLYGIGVDPREIRLHHEYYGIVRRLPLGDAPTQTEPSGQFGEAFGRIEDGAIIVESSGFPNLLAGMASDFDPNGLAADVPPSARKEFTERYTLSDDGRTLFVEYTIVDPV